MTPKEKAFELVDKFRMNVLDYGGSGLNIFKAKQCALISVDEIIKCAIWKYNAIEHTIYWKEVKEEIEKI